MTTTTMTKHPRCHQLGICQGLGPNDCPDCTSWECAVPCTEPPRPSYPFAPGVIQKGQPGRYIDQDGEWFPLSLADTAKLISLLAVLSCLAGYLVEKYL